MKHTHLVQKTTSDFLNQLGFGSSVEINVTYDSENDIYQISLQTSEPGSLIGYHGETLSSLQLLLGQHLHSIANEWLNLSLNINDYRERREATLKSLADSTVEQVIKTGIPHSLPPMPSNERRVIHLYLSDNSQVTTSSEGVGRKRYLVISPKNAD